MSFGCNNTSDNMTKCFESNPFPDGLIVWIYNEQMYHDVNLPCVIYLCVLAVLGIVGNSLMIYIYGANFERRTAHLFILCLSVFDIMCCVPILFEIFDKRFPMYSGKYGTLCKFVRIIEMFSTISSTILLLCIALDRYYKVCKPFERKHFSYFQAKKCVIFSVIVGIILCWPIGFVKGPEQIDTGVKNVYGYDCGEDDFLIGSAIPTLYYSLIGFLNIVAIIILCVLYVQIFRAIQIWKREQIADSISTPRLSVVSSTLKQKGIMQWLNKVTQKHASLRESHNHSESAASNGVSDNDGQIPDEDGDVFPDIGTTLRSSHTNHIHYSNTEKPRKHSIMSLTSVTSTSTKGGSKRTKKLTTNTMLFSVITIIYIISYLPTITIETLGSSGVFVEEKLPSGIRRLLVVLNATYFINNVANQYVYSAISPLFRQSIKKIFTGH